MAIKVLHRGSTPEERASLENRFAREVNMMSRVKHENLVKVRKSSLSVRAFFKLILLNYKYHVFSCGSILLSIFVSYDLYFTNYAKIFALQFIGACKEPLMVIVTELLPGMSLRKYLTSNRKQQLDPRMAINFALDVARAMDCLHANGIIHRDLKPGIFSQIYLLL